MKLNVYHTIIELTDDQTPPKILLAEQFHSKNGRNLLGLIESYSVLPPFTPEQTVKLMKKKNLSQLVGSFAIKRSETLYLFISVSTPKSLTEFTLCLDRPQLLKNQYHPYLVNGRKILEFMKSV